MPVWAFIVLGVGGIMATIATTPLWVWVASRPKVSFASELGGYWCCWTPTRLIYFCVTIELVNEGSEASGPLWAQMEVSPIGAGPYDVELLSDVASIGRIDGNGGRARKKLVFSLNDPGKRKSFPGATDQLDCFLDGAGVGGTLVLRLSQNRRLLWGKDEISEAVFIRGALWGEFFEWAGETGLVPEPLPSDEDD